MRHSAIDFTRGSIIKSLVLFSLPIVLGEILQGLYNSADALIVGRLVGKIGLAAVTVCGTIANLVVMFFNGMSVGSNVVVAKAFGRNDPAELEARWRPRCCWIWPGPGRTTTPPPSSTCASTWAGWCSL